MAEQVISSCAHPDYRDLLWDYYKRAVRTVGGHEPHLLAETSLGENECQHSGADG